MTLNERIEALAALGDYLKSCDEESKATAFAKAEAENPWFTKVSINRAWQGVIAYLEREKLVKWTARYSLSPSKPKTVGLVLAGNIPLVGFHDVISVLVAGHKALVKLSSQDSALMKFVFAALTEVQPMLGERVAVAERLNAMEAVIATGSDNSSRYFEYYFSKVPHIIRKNRSSCAIINGTESPEELALLADDMYSYFGLGCRNVSKVYVPKEYDITFLLDHLGGYSNILDHYKYKNNYDYHKSILLVNQEHHLDTGFSLFKESDALVSPLSIVYFERYSGLIDLAAKVEANKEKIQVIAAQKGTFPGSLPFGSLQKPELWDYADGVDTLKFLSAL